MRQHLLQWQWELYPDNHKRKVTLVIHLFTMPLFVIGTLMLGATPLFGWHFAVCGVLFMLSTFMMQGWAHKQEDGRPAPFLGPMDFVSRFFVEQFVTFPRFVLSGKIVEAWKKN